jgi:hypothetical protein
LAKLAPRKRRSNGVSTLSLTIVDGFCRRHLAWRHDARRGRGGLPQPVKLLRCRGASRSSQQKHRRGLQDSAAHSNVGARLQGIHRSPRAVRDAVYCPQQRPSTAGLRSCLAREWGQKALASAARSRRPRGQAPPQVNGGRTRPSSGDDSSTPTRRLGAAWRRL